MSTQVFFTPRVVPLTNFNRNLGDLKMHTGPPSAIGLIRTVKFLKSISMGGNDIVKMCTKLCLNGSGTALANSINFISYKYNVYKLRLYSPMINARATFNSKCKESERDKNIQPRLSGTY